MKCVLCNGPTKPFEQWQERIFLKCNCCNSVLVPPKFFLEPAEEKIRYENHNNDVDDPGYKNFVKPIVTAIQKDFKKNSLGLDYGCGTGPVISVELRNKGYSVNLYDPYFAIYPEVLKKSYDFIICCEVMEHFQKPRIEFERLFKLLLPKGRLYCKTSLYSDSMDFSSWYYKNDPTHVFFYSVQSLQWIKENVGFSRIQILQDVIIFEK